MRLELRQKVRPAVKWHGGKAYLARRMVSMLPAHGTYVEPFAGGLSVLLNKRRTEMEIAGDLNADLMGFYTCLRDRPDDLIKRLRSITYERESFEWACTASEESEPIEAAVRFLVKNRFSRGGLGRNFVWSERQRGKQPGDLNAWETILDELPVIAGRLQGVHLLCRDALELIERLDSPETLFYLDPPYVHRSRSVPNAYRHEMSDEDHRRLLERITSLRGKVVLSGYANSIYDESLGSWKRHEFDMPNHAGQNKTKERRVEVVWMNPACDRFSLA
jgi:DNA adenine methylase